MFCESIGRSTLKKIREASGSGSVCRHGPISEPPCLDALGAIGPSNWHSTNLPEHRFTAGTYSAIGECAMARRRLDPSSRFATLFLSSKLTIWNIECAKPLKMPLVGPFTRAAP